MSRELDLHAEESPIESCDYRACRVYGLDARRAGFQRRAVVTVPSALAAQRAKVCSSATDDQCDSRVLESMRGDADGEDEVRRRLLARYLERVDDATKAVLKPIAPAPSMLENIQPEPQEMSTRAVRLVLGNDIELGLRLRELWTVPSYRLMADESGLACDPARLSSCRKADRWVSGVRSKRWVCSSDPVRLLPDESKTYDCSARASLVVVEVQLPDGSWLQGSRALVEPGALNSAVETRQYIPLRELFFSPSAAAMNFTATRAGLAFIGNFVEEPNANTTLFLAVVVVPWARLGIRNVGELSSTSARTTP